MTLKELDVYEIEFINACCFAFEEYEDITKCYYL